MEEREPITDELKTALECESSDEKDVHIRQALHILGIEDGP